MTKMLSHEPVFTPRSAETWREPWPMYAALRDHDPVHHVIPGAAPADDYWVLTRHAMVHEVARDFATFSSANGLTVNYDELEQTGMADNPPLVMQDPPTHTEFRRLVSRGFTPRQVETVEPAVREFVRDRLHQLADTHEGDIVDALLKPLPRTVVAHYLGVPEEDRGQFDIWTEAIFEASAGEGFAHGGDAIADLMAYFTELIARRHSEPGDDTISHLVAAGMGVKGDDAGKLSILGFAFTMVAGGNDTTTGMLGGAVQLLTEHPDQRALLLEDTSRITDSIDEFLRLTSPVQALARTVTKDVNLDGTIIPAGRKVLLVYGAANRDDRMYGSDAEDLKVLRRPQQILTFSHGAHHCLGAAAARIQARVALEELLSICPTFDVDIEAVTFAPGNYVRRPTSIPFRSSS